MTSRLTMHNRNHLSPIPALAVGLFLLASPAGAFEGRIAAASTQGNQTTPLLYTVGTNHLRIEVAATNWPHPVDLVDLSSGVLTLVFPHNRSFVRLKPAPENTSGPPPGMFPMPVPAGIGPVASRPPGASAMPAPPVGPQPGVGSQAQPVPGAAGMLPVPQMPPAPAGLPRGVGPQPTGSPGLPGAPGMESGMPAEMPAMSTMPLMPMMMEKLELKATGEKTNLLGYACERFELKQRGELIEIWATDQLLPFQAYQRNQPHPAPARRPEEQWPELMEARRLFPLLVTLRFENGPERYRFEVNSIQAEKIPDPDGHLFQPPPDYHEIEPLPF